MKRWYTLLAIILLHNIAHAEIFDFWNDLNHQTTLQLSELQNFQLAYLRDELQKNHTLVQTEWILNQDVRTLLEIMELSVQQSSAETQDLFKQKIIQIFKQFDIDVYFSNIGLIEKVNPTQNLVKKNGHISKKLKFHHSQTFKSIKSRPPQKIKGANRTRKKLEEAWKKRKEEAKRATTKEQQKRTVIEKPKGPTPADHMAQKIWENEMERHMKILSPDKENNEEKEINELHGEA